MRATRIEFLDGARATAAAVVAISHGAEAFYPAYYSWQTNWLSPGRIGVVLFFMISGFLFASQTTQGTRPSFAARRATRIFIPYWIILFVYLIAWSVLEDKRWAQSTVIANIFLTQPAMGVESIVPPAWTLPIELVLYALIFIAIPAGPRWFKTSAYSFAGLTVLLSVAAVSINSPFPVTIPLLLAIALASASLRLHTATNQRSMTVAMIVVAAIAAGWAQHATQPTGAFQWSVFSYVASTLLGIILFIALWVRRIPLPFTKLAGEVSYSLYLTHPLAYLITKQLSWNPTSSLAMYLAMSVILAKAFFEFAERPSITAGRWLSTRISRASGGSHANQSP